MFLGAFYGLPLLSPPTSSRQDTLLSLERDLFSRYQAAREELVSALKEAGPVAGGGREDSADSAVRERYHDCFLAQTRLARLRRYMAAEGENPDMIGRVFGLQQTVVDYTAVSLSQLYRLASFLVNSMLILSGPGEEKEGAITGNFTHYYILVLYNILRDV